MCLLDVSMPGVGGAEAARALRHRWPALKMLVVSFDNRPDVMLNMLRCGAVAYLLKDSGLDEWGQAIRAVHYDGYHFSQKLVATLIEHVCG